MKLRDGVFELVKNQDARDAFLELAETAFDSITDDGLLKDIPVLGILAKSRSAYIAIKDRIFIKKLEAFLNALDGIEQAKRETFLKDLEDSDERERTGERLILILDRQDDLKKADLIGWIFRKYILGEIDGETFEMLCHAVTNAYIGDLEGMDVFLERPDMFDGSVGFILMAAGLATLQVDVTSLDGGMIDGSAGNGSETLNRFKLTSLGVTLTKIIADRMG